ncbi:VOC family protein [Undibacterium terreum]|uniref:Glyoxalase n=1 Tax=Undibacterium terreum TaxID=1224302 RepID=A0A916UM92_9BURK|nr:VOC family protein [Undibacterium terreum]GGC77027.1 glyoxalase [Undibacterium terreum]
MHLFSRQAMPVNRSMPDSQIIPELAYPDVAIAAEWLCRAFGFTERLRIANHRVQLTSEGGAIVVTEMPQDAQAGQAQFAAHSLMMRITEIDQHYDHARQCGALILRPPADQAYGERQYTARDIGGHCWTFSQTIKDVDPVDWGGLMVF